MVYAGNFIQSYSYCPFMGAELIVYCKGQTVKTACKKLAGCFGIMLFANIWNEENAWEASYKVIISISIF